MAWVSGVQVAETIVEFVHHHIFVGRSRLLVDEGVDLQGHRELLHVGGVEGHLGRGGQEKEWEYQQI